MADEPRTSARAELVRAVAWPLFALVTLVVVGGPLRTLLTRANDVLGASSKVSYGAFSVEVDKIALLMGDRELGTAIRGLSGKAIGCLLSTGSAEWVMTNVETSAYETELAKAGLLELLKPEGPGKTRYRLTDRGKRASALLIEAIVRQAEVR